MPIKLTLKVKPNSSENRFSWENGILVVRIHAPAREGKANEALIDFLSTELSVPKSQIQIIKGRTASFKQLLVPDVCKAKIDAMKAELE